MAEGSRGRKRYSARKTPSSVHPAALPKLDPSIENIFRQRSDLLLEQSIHHFREKMVTSQILYRPGILAGARINFHGSRWDLHHERDIWKVVSFPPKPQLAAWEDCFHDSWDNRDSCSMPQGVSFFAYDSTFDFSRERFQELQEDFIQHLLSHEVLEVECNPYLKMDKKPEETEGNFLSRCLERAHQELGPETQTLEDTLQRFQNRLREKLDREIREIGKEQLELQAGLTADGMPIQTQRRQRSGSEMDIQNEMDVQESIATIEDIKKEMENLETVSVEKRKEFEENVTQIARFREKDLIRIGRADVEVLRFALIWLPFTEFILQEDDARTSHLVRSF